MVVVVVFLIYEVGGGGGEVGRGAGTVPLETGGLSWRAVWRAAKVLKTCTPDRLAISFWEFVPRKRPDKYTKVYVQEDA